MEQKLGRVKVMLVTIAAAAAAYGLRLCQLNTMYDETGLVKAGSGKGILTWLCLGMVLAWAVYAFFLRPRKKYAAIASPGRGVFAASLIGAAGVALGSVALIVDLQKQTDLLLAAFGLVTALCWVVIALDRLRRRTAPAVLFMIPALFFAVKLIFEFRNWSRDPMILDYCFDLLALICVMCASFHLGGFCFDAGRRRITAFFCGCGVIFGAAAMAGGMIREFCMTGGGMVWLLANLWLLLRPARKSRTEQEQG